MAGKAYDGNYKAWLAETAPTDWSSAEGERTFTATELAAATRLLRLTSNNGVNVVMNQNTASQALLDKGKISHNIGTREVSSIQITHELDFPLNADTMFNLWAYGDKRYLVVAPNAPDDEPVDGDLIHIFEVEVGQKQPQPTAQDGKQNLVVTLAVQEWDLDVAYDDESS